MSWPPPSRPGRQALLVAAAALAGVPLACKTMQPQQASQLQAAEVRPLQCDPAPGFRGICQVLEVSGRLGTTTEAARTSTVGDLTELRVAIPASATTGQAQVLFFRKSGPVTSWAIDQAVDLYDRKGCLAEISGGVFQNGFVPQLTIRLLMNLTDDGRTAYAELTDYDAGKAVQAMLALRCDWQS